MKPSRKQLVKLLIFCLCFSFVFFFFSNLFIYSERGPVGVSHLLQLITVTGRLFLLSNETSPISLLVFENETDFFRRNQVEQELLNLGWTYSVVLQRDPRHIHRDKSKSKFLKVPLHYILCNRENQLVIISVIIKRDNFFYASGLEMSEYFDLKCRISTELQMKPIALDSELFDDFQMVKFLGTVKVFQPSNLGSLRWYLSLSKKFLECNYESIVWPFRQIYKVTDSSDTSEVAEIIGAIRHLSLRSLIPVTIYAGTLLGWYRQCDFIPYSSDLDYTVDHRLIENPLFLVNLWNSSVVKPTRRYGVTLDGLILKLKTAGNRQVDIFAISGNEFKNFSYTYYYDKTNLQSHRVLYPNTNFEDICTCALLGRLTFCPCEPLGYIEAEYKTEWFEPHQYFIGNNMESVKTHTEQDWPTLHYIYSKENCDRPTALWGCDPPKI